MNTTDSIKPIFYVRGFNPPYSEGHIAIARNMIKALSLNGIRSTVFNYKYAVRGPTNDCENFTPMRYEQNIPIVRRDELLYQAATLRSRFFFALSVEALATFRFLARERRMNNSCSCPIVNIINCFRYPRFLAGIFLRNPVVLHLYVRDIPENMVRIIVDRADNIIVSSKSLANHYRKKYDINELKLRTIYPPIDTDVYKPSDKNLLRKNINIDEQAKIMLYVGNLSASRFPEEIVLPLMNKIVKKAPETLLFVYAPETSRNNKRKREILAKAKKLSLAANVKIDVRNLSEIDKSVIYSMSDVFLFPSLISMGAVEPPLTVLEAMSSGLVVVSDDVLSTKEVIADGINGLIVPFRNGEVSQLEERISSMLEDKEAISAISGNARRSIMEKMSLDDSGKKLIELFGNLRQ